MKRKSILLTLACALALMAQTTTRVDYPTQVKGGPLFSDAGPVGSTLQSLCATVGAGTLAITKQWTALSTQTVTCNIQFAGGTIQPASGQEVTITGRIISPLTQIFDTSTSGVVMLASSSAPQLYPQWWGAKEDGSTDDTNSLNQSIATSISSSIPLNLPAGTFSANTASGGVVLLATLSPTSQLNIYSAATINTTATASDLLKFYASSGNNPVVNIWGSLNLVGPDNITDPGCTGSKTSGNGFYLEGNTGAILAHIANVKAKGFCGAAKSAILIRNVENSTFDNMIATNSTRGMMLESAVNANTFNTATVAQNSDYGLYDSGSSNNTWNSLTVQSNSKTGRYCLGCSINTYNSPHYEGNNTSNTSGQYANFLDAFTAGITNGNVENAPVYEGAHESIYIHGTTAHATYGNMWLGGLSNSAASPFVIEDGPDIGSNTFTWLTDMSQISKINNSTGSIANLNGDTVCGNYRSGATNCYIPQAAAGFPGTYADIIAAYASATQGATADFTDSATSVPGNVISGGRSGHVKGYFDGTNWVVMGATAPSTTSFTPGLSFGGGSTGITYSVQSGVATQSGNVLTIYVQIQLTSKGSSTGVLGVTGFPAAAQSALGQVLVQNLATTPSSLVANIQNTNTVCRVYIGNGQSNQLFDTDFNNNSVIEISISYHI